MVNCHHLKGHELLKLCAGISIMLPTVANLIIVHVSAGRSGVGHRSEVSRQAVGNSLFLNAVTQPCNCVQVSSANAQKPAGFDRLAQLCGTGATNMPALHGSVRSCTQSAQTTSHSLPRPSEMGQA
jgi:hypothetical protein